MPRTVHPWAASSTRHAIQQNSSAPLASSGPHNFTHSASTTSRVNHGAHDISLLNHAGRPSFSNRPFPSLMTSRTLPSGQLLIYLRDTALTDRTVEDFREKLSGPLGFDIEYRPNFVKGRPLNKTALVQLASSSVILLVQVSAMSAFPDTIKNILEDSTIVKAGVGIQDDANKLRTDFGINPASCLELGYLARAIDQQWADSTGLISLARLVKAYEDRVFKKPKSVQISNWERPLTEGQQNYAAGDADAALSVLQKLYAILPSVQPPPAKTLYLF